MVLLIITGVLTNSVGTSTEYSAFIIATEGEVRFDSRLTRFFRLSFGSDILIIIFASLGSIV